MDARLILNYFLALVFAVLIALAVGTGRADAQEEPAKVTEMRMYAYSFGYFNTTCNTAEFATDWLSGYDEVLHDRQPVNGRDFVVEVWANYKTGSYTIMLNSGDHMCHVSDGVDPKLISEAS